MKTPACQDEQRENPHTGVTKEYETYEEGRGGPWTERAVWNEMAADRNSDGE